MIMFFKASNYKALQFLQTRVQVVFEYKTTTLCLPVHFHQTLKTQNITMSITDIM